MYCLSCQTSLYAVVDDTRNATNDHSPLSAQDAKRCPYSRREVCTKLAAYISRSSTWNRDDDIPDETSNHTETRIEPEGESRAGDLELCTIEALSDPEKTHLIPLVRAVFALDGIHVFVAVYIRFRIVGLESSWLGLEDHMVCPERCDAHCGD